MNMIAKAWARWGPRSTIFCSVEVESEKMMKCFVPCGSEQCLRVYLDARTKASISPSNAVQCSLVPLWNRR